MTSIHRTSGALVLTAVLLTACSSTDSDTDSSATTSSSRSSTASTSAGSSISSSPTSSSPTSAGEYSDSVDAALAALRTAADAVPGGRPYDLEQDDFDGQDAWEIKVASAGDTYKLYVSADGTDVVDKAQDRSPGDDLRKIQQAEVEAADALRTAADEHSGAEFDELEIDTRNGTLVWEIELVRNGGSEIEVYVDATTGKIIG